MERGVDQDENHISEGCRKAEKQQIYELGRGAADYGNSGAFSADGLQPEHIKALLCEGDAAGIQAGEGMENQQGRLHELGGAAKGEAHEQLTATRRKS